MWIQWWFERHGNYYEHMFTRAITCVMDLWLALPACSVRWKHSRLQGSYWSGWRHWNSNLKITSARLYSHANQLVDVLHIASYSFTTRWLWHWDVKNQICNSFWPDSHWHGASGGPFPIQTPITPLRSIHLRSANRFNLAMRTAIQLATGQLNLDDQAWGPSESS